MLPRETKKTMTTNTPFKYLRDNYQKKISCLDTNVPAQNASEVVKEYLTLRIILPDNLKAVLKGHSIYTYFTEIPLPSRGTYRMSRGLGEAHVLHRRKSEEALEA